MAAARKKQGDIIIGNLVGSNIFNIFSIIGITAMVKPFNTRPEILNVDFWIMMAVSILVSVILFRTLRFNRPQGVMMLVIYGIYIAYLAVTQFAISQG
ncbi:MAG: hypothetical protein R2865_08635 [Deinococcales bacterium]